MRSARLHEDAIRVIVADSLGICEKQAAAAKRIGTAAAISPNMKVI